MQRRRYRASGLLRLDLKMEYFFSTGWLISFSKERSSLPLHWVYLKFLVFASFLINVNNKALDLLRMIK